MRKSHTYYVTWGEWSGFEAGKLLEFLCGFMSSGIANVIQQHATASATITLCINVHKRERERHLCLPSTKTFDACWLLCFHVISSTLQVVLQFTLEVDLCCLWFRKSCLDISHDHLKDYMMILGGQSSSVTRTQAQVQLNRSSDYASQWPELFHTIISSSIYLIALILSPSE